MKVACFFFIFLCFVFIGCQSWNGKPKVLPINTMKLVMWDLLKADELYIRQTINDSTLKKKKENIKLYAKVFEIHKLTKDAFYNSYKYYVAHPIEYKTLVDSLESYGNKERAKATTNHGQAK